MTRVFLDANVFLYAIGQGERERDACRRILELVVDERLGGETSVEVLQEVAHVRARRLGIADAVARGRWAMALGLAVHAVEPRDLSRAFGLLEAVATFFGCTDTRYTRFPSPNKRRYLVAAPVLYAVRTAGARTKSIFELGMTSDMPSFSTMRRAGTSLPTSISTSSSW